MSALPAIGSRWRYPGWTAATHTGPWEVTAADVPGEEGRVVRLRRVADGREHEALVAFWPSGWVRA